MATTKKKKTGRQNYDWTKIKTDYVTDPKSSLRKIARKYGISLKAVADKSKAENWFATKQKTNEETITKATTKLITKRSDQLAKEIEIADKAADVLLKAFSDAEQWNRHIVSESVSDGDSTMSTSSEKIFQKIDTRALKDAVQALKLIEEMKRSMLNIQKADQLNRERREDRRLEMEEERLQMEKQKNNLATGDEDSYGVMILPEVLTDE